MHFRIGERELVKIYEQLKGEKATGLRMRDTGNRVPNPGKLCRYEHACCANGRDGYQHNSQPVIKEEDLNSMATSLDHSKLGIIHGYYPSAHILHLERAAIITSRDTITKAVFRRVPLITARSCLRARRQLRVGIRGRYHPSNPSPSLARMGRALLVLYCTVL